MKRRMSIVFLLVGVLLLGCEDQLPKQEVSLFVTSETKGEASSANPYFVSEQDVLELIERRYKHHKLLGEEHKLKTLEPLFYEGVIVFYLARYDSRWELYASDKRLPYLLAYSETADFDEPFFMDCNSPWAENYLMSTYRLRTDPLFLGVNDIDSTEIADNIAFWDSEIDRNISIDGFKENTTRDGGGHWELTEYYEDYVFYSQTSHMLPTNWNQSTPYNNGCPIIPGDPFQTRYFTGSSPLAMALLLYYYHLTEGVPQSAPSSGVVQMSPIDSMYHYYPTHYSSTVWNSMTSVPDSCSALIGLLRDQTGVRFDNGLTVNPVLSVFTYFVDNLLDFWGLSGQMTAYSTYVIDNILEAGYPVLAFAASGRIQHLFGDDEYTNNHTYLIDAFLKYQKAYFYYYEWIPDNPDPAQMMPAGIQEITYGDVSIRYYGINFCAGDNASTAWFIKSNAVTYYNNTYQYNRHILGNVTILDD